VLPNFLIIGAARSGTTTLYNRLQGHPDIYLPASKRPEPHFFLKGAELGRGLRYYEERYFSRWSGQKAVGEASTSYVFGADVPQRIRASLPDVKLICLLRNPVERAFSGYWHTVASGLETLSFEDAIAREGARKTQLAGTALGEIAPFAYVERGLYHEQLLRWLRVFERSALKIVLFDDLIGQPEAMLHDIVRFLGVPPQALPSRELEKENMSVPDGIRISKKTRELLIERFRDDVTALEALLGRDLRHWLAAEGADKE